MEAGNSIPPGPRTLNEAWRQYPDTPLIEGLMAMRANTLERQAGANTDTRHQTQAGANTDTRRRTEAGAQGNEIPRLDNVKSAFADSEYISFGRPIIPPLAEGDGLDEQRILVAARAIERRSNPVFEPGF